MTLEQIERLCRAYDEARGVLSTRVSDLEGELDAAKRRSLPGIKRAVAKAAEAEAALRAAVDGAPELFTKPKTQIFHGVKVGYRKGPGGLDWADEDDVVAKIERHFGDDAETYLIVKKKPSAEALEDLDAATLKKLGVTVVDVGDVIVVKPVDGAVDKLVKALLKDAVEDATEAA